MHALTSAPVGGGPSVSSLGCFIPGERPICTHWIGAGGFQSLSGRCAEQRNLFLQPGIEPQFLRHPTRILSQIYLVPRLPFAFDPPMGTRVLGSHVAILVMDLATEIGRYSSCAAGRHKLFQQENEWDTCSVLTLFLLGWSSLFFV